MDPRTVNMADKLSQFSDHWHPRIVGQVNDMHVKLAKLKGEFDWHRHAAEDELFLVIRGRLVVQLRDRDLVVEPGEFVVVPRGVEHRPVAEEEVEVMLIEPVGTLNTGDVRSERTVEELEWL